MLTINCNRKIETIALLTCDLRIDEHNEPINDVTIENYIFNCLQRNYSPIKTYSIY